MSRRDLILGALERVCRLILGGIFIYAAWSKIQDPALFAKAIVGYQMLPSFFVGPLALVLPMAELLAGAALIATRWTRESTLLILCMLAMFFVGLTQALVRGLDISCGCFGDDANSTHTVLSALLRDVVLLVPAVWLVRRPNAWLWNKAFGVAVLAALVVTGAVLARPTAVSVQPEAVTVQPEDEKNSKASTESDDDAPFTPPIEQCIAILKPSAATTPRQESAGTVPAEVWTNDFPTALACAQANNAPLVMFGRAKRCTYCERLGKVLHGGLFRKWVRGTGIYLAEGLIEGTNKPPAMAQMAKFIEDSPHTGNLNKLPVVGIYWPMSSTNELRTIFIGRRSLMPHPLHPSLACEFIGSLEKALGGHLGTCSEHTPLAKLIDSSVKYIKVDSPDGAKVTIFPKDGSLRNNGIPVVIAAKPPKGMTLSGWRAPDGSKLRPASGAQRNQLKVTYGMPAGTYAPIFKKRR